MAHILVVEDHENLRLSLKVNLERDGHQVEVAENMTAAQKKISAEIELVILDWLLPDGQGLDFLAEVRRQKNLVPIIFLTAKAELVDKVLGLEMGANDYLTKPFEFRELQARIRVQLREKSSIPATRAMTLEVGSLLIDRNQHRVLFRGSLIELVKKEFELLAFMAEEPEKVFSREEILNKVWGYEIYPTTRTVDTHVMLLRQKVHEGIIETVRAVGYRLRII